MSFNIMPERASVRMAKAKAATVSGVATILIQVPGTPGSSDGRIISGGNGWFDSLHADDHIEIYITDEDNLKGGGAGLVIGTYTDTDCPLACQGWFINPHKGFVDIRQLETFGFLPAGFYVKIIGTKGDLSSDTFRVNLKWGKR